MAQTYAQIYRPQKVYGMQTERGNNGERKAAKILRSQGYTVKYTAKHPHGKYDLIATKRNMVKQIQVKNITSRSFKTATAARRRMRIKPYYVTYIGRNCELWVFDKDGHLYKFTH